MQRCAADNPRAALAIGIHVSNQVSIAWAASAALAGLGGTLLATLGGLSLNISDIGLIAFPVIVVGGLDSLIGALIAGFLLGILEAFTEGMLTPGLEDILRRFTTIQSVGALQQVIPYALLVLMLLVRPQGIFGRAARSGCDVMTTRQLLIALAIAIAFAAIGYNSGRFWAYLIYAVAIAGIGALSLNLLIGFCGQITFAQGALVGVGAYAAGNLGNAGWGVLALIGAGVAGAFFSAVIGLPALRLRGLYFAISTLAAQFILSYLFKILQPLTHGVSGLVVKPLTLFGRPVGSDQEYAVICRSPCCSCRGCSCRASRARTSAAPSSSSAKANSSRAAWASTSRARR